MDKIESRRMRITNVTDDEIEFNDGEYYITWSHDQDCCERTYADFLQLDDLAIGYEFKGELFFEKVFGGFRFGDSRFMFFVPCYSCQNGYYSSDVDIYFCNEHVLTTEAEMNYVD